MFRVWARSTQEFPQWPLVTTKICVGLLAFRYTQKYALTFICAIDASVKFPEVLSCSTEAGNYKIGILATAAAAFNFMKLPCFSAVISCMRNTKTILSEAGATRYGVVASIITAIKLLVRA